MEIGLKRAFKNMTNERIDLYGYFKIERKGATGGYLTAYVSSPSVEIKPKLRPAMLVIPGGGYEYLSDREGEPVALRFLSEGYCAFVLTYSIFTAYPTPLIEACLAVAYIRENASRFCADALHVAAVGFSAGGHLAGLLATVREEEIKEALGDKANLVRPNAVILSYPVITMTDGLTHEGTQRTISGGVVPCDVLSIEKRVTKDSAPAFIWHTSEDDCVPVENSLLLAEAYRKAGVPFNLHIFERGWHGLSLNNAETSDETKEDEAIAYVGKWVTLALDWLASRGFCVKVNSKK